MLEISLGWFNFFDFAWSDRYLLALDALRLLLHENFNQLLEVKTKLIRVALLDLLESLESHNVVSKHVVHLLRQHELLFVELQEGLKLYIMFLVLFILLLACTFCHDHASCRCNWHCLLLCRLLRAVC
jgi:hypothetical protein